MTSFTDLSLALIRQNSQKYSWLRSRTLINRIRDTCIVLSTLIDTRRALYCTYYNIWYLPICLAITFRKILYLTCHNIPVSRMTTYQWPINRVNDNKVKAKGALRDGICCKIWAFFCDSSNEKSHNYLLIRNLRNLRKKQNIPHTFIW